MNKIIYYLIINLLIISGCNEKQHATLNPFDSQFDINMTNLYQHVSDTLPAGCGYFNLIIEKEKHQIYYQVYEFHDTIEGKGLSLTIDSLQVRNYTDKSNDDSVIAVLRAKPFDTSIVDQIMASYKMIRTNNITPWTLTYMDEHRNRFDLSINISFYESSSQVKKNLNYLVFNPSK